MPLPDRSPRSGPASDKDQRECDHPAEGAPGGLQTTAHRTLRSSGNDLDAEQLVIGAPARGRDVEGTGPRPFADPAPVEAVAAERRPQPSGQVRLAFAPIQARLAERHRAGLARWRWFERDAEVGQALQALGRDQPRVLIKFDPVLGYHGASERDPEPPGNVVVAGAGKA